VGPPWATLLKYSITGPKVLITSSRGSRVGLEPKESAIDSGTVWVASITDGQIKGRIESKRSPANFRLFMMTVNRDTGAVGLRPFDPFGFGTISSQIEIVKVVGLATYSAIGIYEIINLKAGHSGLF